jgi:prepilin-type processing-associated H-X9-DG protein
VGSDYWAHLNSKNPHKTEGANFLYCDGSVKWWSAFLKSGYYDIPEEASRNSIGRGETNKYTLRFPDWN